MQRSVRLLAEEEKKLMVILNYLNSGNNYRKCNASDAIKYAIHNQWVMIQHQYYQENKKWCDPEWLKNFEAN